jgi:hypothetical protein
MEARRSWIAVFALRRFVRRISDLIAIVFCAEFVAAFSLGEPHTASAASASLVSPGTPFFIRILR